MLEIFNSPTVLHCILDAPTVTEVELTILEVGHFSTCLGKTHREWRNNIGTAVWIREHFVTRTSEFQQGDILVHHNLPCRHFGLAGKFGNCIPIFLPHCPVLGILYTEIRIIIPEPDGEANHNQCHQQRSYNREILELGSPLHPETGQRQRHCKESNEHEREEQQIEGNSVYTYIMPESFVTKLQWEWFRSKVHLVDAQGR